MSANPAVQGSTPAEPATGAELPPSVLVVTGNDAVARRFATWLDDERDVLVASDVAEAMTVVDPTVDVIVLDGAARDDGAGTVADLIRAAGSVCRVALVERTASPDEDASVDRTLVAPVSRAGLLDAVVELERRAAYDRACWESFLLAERKARLEHEGAADDAAYRSVSTRLDALRARMDDIVAELLTDGGADALFDDLG